MLRILGFVLSMAFSISAFADGKYRCTAEVPEASFNFNQSGNLFSDGKLVWKQAGAVEPVSLECALPPYDMGSNLSTIIATCKGGGYFLNIHSVPTLYGTSARAIMVNVSKGYSMAYDLYCAKLE